MTMLLTFYRTISAVGGPAITWYLKRRLNSGKEDRLRFDERKGISHIPRPKGPLIWVHCASVGESVAVLPLIEILLGQYPKFNLMITTGTVTSATLLEERLPKGVIHQYVPIDRKSYVCRFLDRWHPDLVLWIESEFWPNLITISNERRIPQVLVNGRMSPESFSGWQHFRGLIKCMLQSFELCLAQGEDDKERLRKLGAKKVKTLGNLKYATPALPADTENLNFLRYCIGQRRCWLAASTHAGEESIIGDVHTKLKLTCPDILTIIAPRHPSRGPEIANLLKSEGYTVARRSKGHLINSDTDIYLADTLGELGLFFRLAPVSFMGKSLINLGGQNPLEPARLGSAVLFGPHMWNFPDIAETLLVAGAAELVKDADTLTAALNQLLLNPQLCGSRGVLGQEIAGSQSDILQRIMDELKPFLRAVQ